MKTVQQGFTLIELMIVVAIIAILAAIAIPQYQTYVIKSQVTRAMDEASSQKVVVEDCMNNGATTLTAGTSCQGTATASDILTGTAQPGEALPTGVTDAGFPTITMNADGTATIEAALGNHAATTITGSTVTWTRDANANWSCAYAGTGAEAKYAPASCPVAGGG